jgi:molecular chaperone GrpE
VSRRKDDDEVAGAATEEHEAEEQGEPEGVTTELEQSAEQPSPEAELRAEVEALQEQLLRRRAEFENFRRRIEKERAQIAADAAGELLSELLPTIDNLERAATAAGDEQSVREGVGLILRTLKGVLDTRGVEVEDPAGQPFDPERHQALAHEPAPGHAEGTIVEVFQKGYLLRGRLLRPALVKVAKEDDDAVPPAPEDGETLH